MRICYTPEMDKLRKIYKPYEEGDHLKENAPAEAVEAREEFYRLLHEIEQAEIASWFE